MTAVLLCDAVESPEELGEELPVKIGEDDTQGRRAARAETARRRIGGEVQLARGSENAVARMLEHRRSPVHHPGHRRDGDTRTAGDVLDGRGAMTAGTRATRMASSPSMTRHCTLRR